MDIALSDANGVELLKTIRRLKVVPILVISAQSAPAIQAAVLDAGAAAFLSKPCGLDVRAAQARTLMRLYMDLHGHELRCYALVFSSGLIINPMYRQVTVNGHTLELARKKFDVLCFLAQHPSQVSLDIQKMYNKIKTSGRVQRYEHMKEKGLANRFVRGVHMVLHEALDQAVQERLIPINPTNGCRIPKLEKKEMKVIPPEQIGAYLKAAEERGMLPMFYLELTSGLRRGELLALLWSDLDVEKRTISVTKSLSAKLGEMKVSVPKTPNSIRTVVIPKESVDLLIEEHEKHPDSPYMFMSPTT